MDKGFDMGGGEGGGEEGMGEERERGGERGRGRGERGLPAMLLVLGWHSLCVGLPVCCGHSCM